MISDYDNCKVGNTEIISTNWYFADIMRKISRIVLGVTFWAATLFSCTIGGGTFSEKDHQIMKEKLNVNEAIQEEFIAHSDVNPHAKATQSHSFYDCISRFLKPGVCYITAKPMVAVAEGGVIDIIDLAIQGKYWRDVGNDINGAKGILVLIKHSNHYYSSYLYLNVPLVKIGQKVKRGQLIGLPDRRWNVSGLMLLEDGHPVDPDKYGVNHDYMTYWDGVSGFEIGKFKHKRRVIRQKQLLKEVANLCTGPEKETILMKGHKHGDRVLKWSRIETFQYVEYVYRRNPEKFPSLKKEKFEQIRDEFYNNQPIILTLPFRKG